MEYFSAYNDKYMIRYIIKDTKKNQIYYNVNKDDVLVIYRPKGYTIDNIKQNINKNIDSIVKFMNIRLHNIKMDILNFHNYHLISKSKITHYQFNVPDFIDNRTNNEFILKYEINYFNDRNSFNIIGDKLKFSTTKSSYFYDKLFIFIQTLISNKKIKWNKKEMTRIQEIAFKNNNIKIKLVNKCKNNKFYFFKNGTIFLDYQVIFLHKKIRSYLIDKMLARVLFNFYNCDVHNLWDELYAYDFNLLEITENTLFNKNRSFIFS